MPAGQVYNKMPNPFKWKIPKGEAYVRCESSRGELGLYLVSNGEDKPYRVHFIDFCVNNGTRHNLSSAFLKKDRNSDCWERV